MQDRWMRKMIRKHSLTNSFWRHAEFVAAQLDGLLAGYRAAAIEETSLMPLDWTDFQILNAFANLADLNSDADNFEQATSGSRSTAENQLQARALRNGHCSALIRVLPGTENVFMGHNTWLSYELTNRIFKHYDFNTRDPATSANAMSFSSYPGVIASLDDYYLMSNGIVLLQTSLQFFNASLYSKVTSESLLPWQRVRLANHLAANGSQWYDIFKQFNSGTYNNQYMILDTSKIKLGKRIENEALWVVEQMPGLVLGRDVTSTLRKGYWASYNLPFFEEIYNVSGHPEMVKEYGAQFSYRDAPRAKIFRRDAPRVNDMASMKALLRSNDFRHDKYSRGNPNNAICSRPDLAKAKDGPTTGGCTDAKVTDLAMARERRTWAINGPTRGTGLGVFRWDTASVIFENLPDYGELSHWGTPRVFNFSFVEMKPLLSSVASTNNVERLAFTWYTFLILSLFYTFGLIDFRTEYQTLK